MSYIGKTPEAIGGVPLMTPVWYPSRAYLPAGYVPLDGQLVLRSLYPDATQEVLNGRVPVVSEASWLATPANRGSYTTGNGSTTIRLPDFNGKSSGTLGAAFLRGDGANSLGTNGSVQGDAIRNITGIFGDGFYSEAGVNASTSGAFTHTSGAQNKSTPAAWIATGIKVTFNASNVVPTAADNHPVNITGCWAVKLFGVVTAQAILDTQAVAAQVSSDAAKLASLPLTKEFVSAQQTITSAGALTITHGLGARPKFVAAELVCITAEAGYVAGDVVQAHIGAFASDSVAAYGAGIKLTSTDIVVRFASGSQVYYVTHATTGVATSLTNANWRLVIRAYA